MQPPAGTGRAGPDAVEVAHDTATGAACVRSFPPRTAAALSDALRQPIKLLVVRESFVFAQAVFCHIERLRRSAVTHVREMAGLRIRIAKRERLGGGVEACPSVSTS